MSPTDPLKADIWQRPLCCCRKLPVDDLREDEHQGILCVTARIGQLVDVVGEIGGFSSHEGKNGRTERVHPAKAEEVDAPAGSRTRL